MSMLNVTAKGQVTFRRDVLKHPGVQPGEKISVEKLPDGIASYRYSAVRDKILAVARPRGDESLTEV